MSKHRNPRARLPRRPSPDNTATPVLDVGAAIDDLRWLVGRADALARATEDLLERGPWGTGTDEDDDEHRLDRVSHLLGATIEAVRAARRAGDQLADELAGDR